MDGYSVISDDELVDLIRVDDHKAFKTLYNRYWPTLYQSAYNVCRDRETCMDICQEVFVWFWEHRGSVHFVATVKGYLLAAVKYKMISHLRKGLVKDKFDLSAKSSSEAYTIEEAIELKELQSIILHFVNALPPKCAEIFRLSRNEHLSNKEIAHKLAISEKTVENQITIALKKLKGSLGKLSCWFLVI